MKRRVTTEAYFTSPKLAAECVRFLGGFVALPSFDYVLEPAAGNGVFIDALPGLVIGLDINPRRDNIVRGDFFAYSPPAGRGLVVGNPPFGQRGALAIRFLNRAMEFASVVAFILPRSFKKHAFLNRVNRAFHLLGQFDCEDFVLPDGSPMKVKCVFQVWQRRPELRPLIELATSHPDFDLKHFHLSRTSDTKLRAAMQHYDFAIAQVGQDFKPKTINLLYKGSHWFVRANVAGVRRRFEQLDFGFLDGLNTAHKSLSRKDIVAAYEQVLRAESSLHGH